MNPADDNRQHAEAKEHKQCQSCPQGNGPCSMKKALSDSRYRIEKHEHSGRQPCFTKDRAEDKEEKRAGRSPQLVHLPLHVGITASLRSAACRRSHYRLHRSGRAGPIWEIRRGNRVCRQGVRCDSPMLGLRPTRRSGAKPIHAAAEQHIFQRRCDPTCALQSDRVRDHS